MTAKHNPHTITWLRYAVYYDDELPIVIFKYPEAAAGYVQRIKTSLGLDFRVQEEKWLRTTEKQQR